MLSVCLIFIYMLITAYVTGFAVLKMIRRFCTRQKAAEETMAGDGLLMAGLVFLTVYAQFFSIFYKVGLAANGILAAGCLCIIFIYRKELWEKALMQRSKMTICKAAGCLFLFLLFAYGTSTGIIHYDTGLYHAQSIRWIEEYGAVKGLGNLHCRLAYNSSAFSLSALFSFSFLGGQSFHCAAGFFALIVAKVCGEIGRAWKRRKLLLSDWARVMGIYYLLNIYDEMISPASDYFLVLTVFYIVIRYLDLLEKKEEAWMPYALLSLLCVYTISLKLSAALILLLAVKPAVSMIKEKQIKNIIFFILLGIFILLPFLIRNVILSGWLVYPFTSIDLFPVDWKIPKELADYDSREIQVWGRGIYDVAGYGKPVTQWFLPWFSALGGIDKIFVLAGLATPFVLAPGAAVIIIKKDKPAADWLAAAIALDASFLFWFFSAPLIRYGCVYVWLAPVITYGGPAIRYIKGKWVWRTVYAALLLAGCYKALAFGREAVKAYNGQYLVRQKDYENYEVAAYQIEGVIFYYPAEGDRTGYDAFPSSPSQAEIVFRGRDVGEGFRYKIK